MLSLAWVITLSATRRSSLAFGRVVTIRSWVIRDVTMLRSMAHLWDDVLPNLRNAMRFFIVELGRRQVTKGKRWRFYAIVLAIWAGSKLGYESSQSPMHALTTNLITLTTNLITTSKDMMIEISNHRQKEHKTQQHNTYFCLPFN